jgi:hypothetical protein
MAGHDARSRENKTEISGAAMKPLAVICALIVCTAHAATPCDFKGLSVGDKATPQQIMSHFGIAKYSVDADKPTNSAAEAARLRRAETVGLMNAVEEEEWKEGSACGYDHCRINYGRVSVGSEPFPILVGVEVFFDASSHQITAIDVTYDSTAWDEVLELLNTKYGNNWREDDTQGVTTNYQTKKSFQSVITVLTHREPGINRASGNTCSIVATSNDRVFLHTTPPVIRAVLEIKLISKNF